MLDYWTELAQQNGFSGMKYAYQNLTFDLMPNKDDSRFDYNIEFQPSYAWNDLNNKSAVQKSKVWNFLRNVKRRIYTETEKKLGFDLQRYFNHKGKEKNASVLKTEYDEAWKAILEHTPENEKNIPGAFVGWDNTPRKGHRGQVYVGDTPEKLNKYMSKQIQRAKLIYQKDMIFMYAWNEWAEGGYLEPDERTGYKNISSLLWDSQWAKENHFGLTVDYEQYHVKILEWLMEQSKYKIHIIPHVIDFEQPDARENDYRVCLQLKKKYGDRIEIAPPFNTPIEAKSYIANMNIFIGSRMHATIGAISSGVATIPFSYSRKFEGLFGNLDYPYVISARKFSLEEALEKSKLWIQNYEKLKVCGQKSVEESYTRLELLENDIRCLLEKRK